MRTEQMFEECVKNNVTALGYNGAGVTVVQGPLRLTSADPAAAKALAATALAGSAGKEKKNKSYAVPTGATVANDQVCTLTAGIKACALLIRYSGPYNGWHRRSGIFTIAGTGMTTMKVAIDPNGPGAACAFVLLTTDNGGPGQISAPSGITVTWGTLDNLNTGSGVDPTEGEGDIFSFSVEPVTLRDFAGGRTAA